MYIDKYTARKLSKDGMIEYLINQLFRIVMFPIVMTVEQKKILILKWKEMKTIKLLIIQQDLKNQTLLIKINAVFTGDPILNKTKEKGILKRSNKFLEK